MKLECCVRDLVPCRILLVDTWHGMDLNTTQRDCPGQVSQ
jgi:hypothetical protein